MYSKFSDFSTSTMKSEPGGRWSALPRAIPVAGRGAVGGVTAAAGTAAAVFKKSRRSIGASQLRRDHERTKNTKKHEEKNRWFSVIFGGFDTKGSRQTVPYIVFVSSSRMMPQPATIARILPNASLARQILHAAIRARR